MSKKSNNDKLNKSDTTKPDTNQYLIDNYNEIDSLLKMIRIQQTYKKVKIDKSVADFQRNFQLYIGITSGLFLLGTNLNLFIRIFINFDLIPFDAKLAIIIFSIVIILICFSIFFKPTFGVNFAAGVSSPFVALILVYLRGSEIAPIIALIDGPIILLLFNYGLMLFGVNFMDQISLFFYKRLNKKIYKQHKQTDKIIQIMDFLMSTLFISQSESFHQYFQDKDVNEFILEQLNLIPWRNIFTEEQLKLLDQGAVNFLKSQIEESDEDI